MAFQALKGNPCLAALFPWGPLVWPRRVYVVGLTVAAVHLPKPPPWQFQPWGTDRQRFCWNKLELLAADQKDRPTVTRRDCMRGTWLRY